MKRHGDGAVSAADLHHGELHACWWKQSDSAQNLIRISQKLFPESSVQASQLQGACPFLLVFICSICGHCDSKGSYLGGSIVSATGIKISRLKCGYMISCCGDSGPVVIAVCNSGESPALSGKPQEPVVGSLDARRAVATSPGGYGALALGDRAPAAGHPPHPPASPVAPSEDRLRHEGRRRR